MKPDEQIKQLRACIAIQDRALEEGFVLGTKLKQLAGQFIALGLKIERLIARQDISPEPVIVDRAKRSCKRCGKPRPIVPCTNVCNGCFSTPVIKLSTRKGRTRVVSRAKKPVR